MSNIFSRVHSLECLAALFSVVGFLAVLQSFIVGKHFLIPTMILLPVILFGNLAWYGLHNNKWAKLVLFWGTSVLAAHLFFALFWAKKYREILGDAFEPVFILVLLGLVFLLFDYAKRNGLFVKNSK